MKAAAIAAVTVGGITVGAAPSEAMSFANDLIDLTNTSGFAATVRGSNLGNSSTGQVTAINFGANPNAPVNPNGPNISVSGGTGMFASYFDQKGFIKNISFVNGVSGPVDNFFTVGDLMFDLTRAIASTNGSAASFVFDGSFTNAMGTVLGSGELSTQINLLNGRDRASSFSLTAEAATIPTPALLPGLFGIGAAALRKRKSDQDEGVDA